MPDVTPSLAAVEQALQLAGPDAAVQSMQALARMRMLISMSPMFPATM
jgi:hypothetical protein